MTHQPQRTTARVGVQTKAILITSFIVLTVATIGGWLYFRAASSTIRGSEQRQAQERGQSLALMVAPSLGRQDAPAVRRTVSDLALQPDVRYVAVVDAAGRTLAAASRTGEAGLWSGLCNVPPTMMLCQRLDREVLTVCRPVVADQGDHAGQVLGGARLVLDTRGTAMRLARLQRRVMLIAAAMVVGMVPLGYLMVWRVMVQPLRQMVVMVRKVSGGDFGARTGLRRNDETGELAAALDAMVAEIAAGREQLLRANEHLEAQVAQRTADLRLANDRLRQEMAEKEDFLRVVSHDLSAPLRNIAGMASVLLTRHRDRLSEDAVARLERIQANVDAETQLIGELLEFSRLKSRLDKRDEVDVQAMIQDLAASFEYDLKSRSIELRIGGPLPVMYAERTSIKKVFQNVLDNAIKYMDKPAGGLIRIACQADGDLLHFTVSDNGPGIAPADQERIFCIFRRVENPQTARVPGKGVGLATVKSVATHYGGNAWVVSAPGQGTTFHLTFGACRGAPAGPPARDAQPRSQAACAVS